MGRSEHTKSLNYTIKSLISETDNQFKNRSDKHHSKEIFYSNNLTKRINYSPVKLKSIFIFCIFISIYMSKTKQERGFPKIK